MDDLGIGGLSVMLAQRVDSLERTRPRDRGAESIELCKESELAVMAGEIEVDGSVDGTAARIGVQVSWTSFAEMA